MGKLSKKLQDDIQIALYMMAQGVELRAKHDNPQDREWQAYLHGKIDGINAAKMVIDAWNEPNHGMTEPSLNQIHNKE